MTVQVVENPPQPLRLGERPRDVLIGVTLFLLACWQYFALVDETPFHRDEARWIHRGEYVRELAHPFSAYWDESTWIQQGGPRDAQYRLRAQPPLGSYLMGFGLLAQGRDLETNGYWIMGADTAWNTEQGNMPPASDLTAARRTTAIVSALTVVVVYAIGARLTNRVGGVAAALYLLFHPLVNLHAAFAGSDMLLVFLVALAALAAYRLADRPSWPRAVLLGVLLGLGGATKLSPLGIAVPVALLGGSIILSRAISARASKGHSSRMVDAGPQGGRWGRLRSFVSEQLPIGYGMQLASVPFVAVATLVACYPFLWRAPVDHTLAMFAFRTSAMDVQGAAWPDVAVVSRIDALGRVATRLGEDFTVLGRLGAELDQWLGVTLDTGGFELTLAAVGLVLFAVLVLRSGLWSGHGLAMVVLCGIAAITVAGLGVDWARYHLPILLFVAVCLGVAVGQGWSAVVRLVQTARQESAGARTVPGDLGGHAIDHRT